MKHPFVKNLVYFLSILIVFWALIYIFRLFGSGVTSSEYLVGPFTQKDILLGIGIAIFLTFTHIRRTKNK